MNDSSAQRAVAPRPLTAAAWAAAGAACLWAFWATGERHGGYALRVVGTDFIPASELAFYAWYALWGIPAVVCLARALWLSGLAAPLTTGLRQGTRHRRPLWVALAALSAGTLALAFHVGLTRGLPLSDDEHVYAFIARTLLHGRLVNPLPPEPAWFTNIFTVMNQAGWFGQYPIGHPLVLALGEAVGLRVLVVPLLAGLTVWLTYRLGHHLFDETTAFFGALLLCLSPHFVMTFGTQLSQTSHTAMLLVGALSVCQLLESGRARWAVGAGLAFAACVLIRPMPGVLFVAAAVTAVVVPRAFAGPGRERRDWWLRMLLLGGVASVGLVGILWSNHVQSGAALASGYHLAGAQDGAAPALFFAGQEGAWASSLGGAMMREMFWLLGFPLSALPLFFVRVRTSAVLFWGLIVAQACYRIAVPKTFMAVTGPIYVTEVVPLLTLACVDVLRRLSRWVHRRGAPDGLGVAVVGAGVVVAASAFLPVQLRPIRTATDLRGRVYDGLIQARADRALVFADHLVSPDDHRAWAYFPPNPSPDLSDPIVFARRPPGDVATAARRARAFWLEQMPDRRAFLFTPGRGSTPAELTELQRSRE